MRRSVSILALASLLATGLTARAQESEGASERLRDIESRLHATIMKWSKEMQEKADEARESGQAIPALRMTPPIEPFVTELFEAADDYAGSAEAVPFLMAVVRYGPGAEQMETATEAIEILVEDHLDSPELTELAEFLPQLRYVLDESQVSGWLATMETKSKNADVRGFATVARAGAIVEDESNPVGSARYEENKAALVKVLDSTKNAALVAKIRGLIDGRERLAIGKVAPDIEGEDIDGVAFKLSDYRGKVVMLDFWGDW